MSGSAAPEVVAEKPNLGREILRGALTAKGRPGGSGTLPERVLELSGAEIDRENLYAYQRLCGYPVNDRLPHPYPHLVGFPLQAKLMADRSFPLPLPGLVHIENESTLHRPLSAADRLDIAVQAANLSPHPKGTTVDLLARAELAGELVWESRSRYLHRGRPSGTTEATEGTTDQTQAPGVPDGPVSARWRLPADLGRRYAAVSGDVNPIHLHPLTAKAMGFPRAIAHGMWSSARVLAALGVRTEGPGRARVWFRKPILLPGTVALLREQDGDRTVAALVGGGVPEKRRTHLLLEWRPV
ncbi:hypothetical protein CGZ98_20695 [Enemella evansiae]|uniref:MaoC family dehydratase n=1 Tax=Enemella evansiae TaxID=2016499 RepID=UPI000B966507|nr:MaoC/PaaZ C-terminal domain-containing protein [Enemella evansiae]OYO06950.1 hypothetical protein CGZ98_20695 [Enemella evansiae]